MKTSLLPTAPLLLSMAAATLLGAPGRAAETIWLSTLDVTKIEQGSMQPQVDKSVFSGDLTRLDEFTLNLLTNDEVIEVDQDPLGQPAQRLAKNGDQEVWAKDLEDGRKAAGLFNLDEDQAAVVTVKWSDLGIRGKQVVRDLWRQQDLGEFDDRFSAPVGQDGVVLGSLRPSSP